MRNIGNIRDLTLVLLQGLFIIISANCSGDRQKKRHAETTDHKELRVMTLIDSSSAVIEDTIRLSFFADSLFYIPLGKTPLGSIEGIRKVVISGTHIFVHDNSGLHLFKQNGDFLRKVSDKCWSFDVLETEQLIYIAYQKHIDVYDFNANLILNKIPLNEEIESTGDFIAAIEADKIAVSTWNKETQQNRLLIIDTLGGTIAEFPDKQLFSSKNISQVNTSKFHCSLFRYNDEILYHPHYSDTLFLLSDNGLSPIFVENIISKVPLQQRLEYSDDIEKFEKYCIENKAYITCFFETGAFTFVVYRLGHLNRSLPNYLLYDKQTRKTYNYKQNLIFENGRLHFGFFNDYDGGLPFNPEYCSGEYLIEAYDAKLFISDYQHGMSLKSCSKNGVCTVNHYEIKSNHYSSLKGKNIIEKLSTQIKPEDNPVLVVAKVKTIER
jgi:hypothetical protein